MLIDFIKFILRYFYITGIPMALIAAGISINIRNPFDGIFYLLLCLIFILLLDRNDS